MLSAPEVKVSLSQALDLEPEIPTESMHTKHTKEREQVKETSRKQMHY